MVYGIQVWGHAPSMNKILVSQKRAIRTIFCKPYRYHTEPLFKANSILNVHDLYRLQVALFVHDLRSAKLPNSFKTFFKISNSDNVNTRHRNIIYKVAVCPRTKFSSLLPGHMFTSIWNNLDKNIIIIKSRSSFKKALMKNMLQKYSEYIRCSNKSCKYCYM